MEMYEDKLISTLKDPVPTQHIKIEGVGEVKVFGSYDAEKIIKRLLESDTITG